MRTHSRRIALASALLLGAASFARPQVPSPPRSGPESVPVSAAERSPTTRPRSVILMIADGLGPASVTMARVCKGAPLALDSFLVGAIRTHATDALVTDSAAAATALAAGVKTRNGAIGMGPDGEPVETALELAQRRGKATGLVATSAITHATPASFAAHVRSRTMEAKIAVQELEHGVEVLLGGGSEQFLPVLQGGRRLDGRDLLGEARELGYRIVADRDALLALDATPVLGLFHPEHMDFELDRPPEQPSLTEMTVKAIELLSANPDGFFLMIEGSRIDHAAHGKDAAGHLGDILEYDRAVAAALDRKSVV